LDAPFFAECSKLIGFGSAFAILGGLERLLDWHRDLVFAGEPA
jgi:hypothetical protein